MACPLFCYLGVIRRKKDRKLAWAKPQNIPFIKIFD